MAVPPVTIRAAASVDAEAIATMAAALLASEGKPPSPFTAAEVRRHGFGDDPAFAVLVAEQEGEIVGYTLYHPGYDPDSASRGLLVADLFVAAPARRRGIGRALLAAVARECRRRGGDWLFWFVLPGNQEARAFYQRLGARTMGAVPLVLDGGGFEELARET